MARRYSTIEPTAEEVGTRNAESRLAESRRLDRERKMVRFQVPDPTRGALATKVVWGMRGAPPENGTELADGTQIGLGFTPRNQWREQFQRRDVNRVAENVVPAAPRDPPSAFGAGLRGEGLHPTAKAVTTRSPLDEFSTTPADARAIANRYGDGAVETYQPKPNELFQPTFRGEKGDRTAAVLPKVPGTDPRLDPVYAAKVFRDAGDVKTAEAYEAHAATLDPSKYTGKGGVAFVNPFFKPSAGVESGASQNAVPVSAPLSPASPAQQLGQDVKRTAADVVRPVARAGLDYLVKPAVATANAVSGLVTDATTASKDFVSGITAPLPGNNAGVSRATAAQFEKPTIANPLPVTPTTPTAKIDETPQSIDRYEPDKDREWNGF